jgi:hypothetical protein
MIDSPDERRSFNRQSDTTSHSTTSTQVEASRRSFIVSGGLSIITTSSASVVAIQPARADSDDSTFGLSQLFNPRAESSKLDTGLLESRVQSNVLNPPPYGMEGSDIFYPS